MGSAVRVGGVLVLAVVFATGAGCLNPRAQTTQFPTIPKDTPAQIPVVKSHPGVTDNMPNGIAVSQPGVRHAEYETNETGGSVSASKPVSSQLPLPVQPPSDPHPAPPAGSIPLPYPRTSFADPNERQTPTNRGAILGLGPDEQPLDRALDIARRLDQCAVENRELLARITALEAKAREREQALDEGQRDVVKAKSDVERARTELATARVELEALRERAVRAEREEIETLQNVVRALQTLIESSDEVP